MPDRPQESRGSFTTRRRATGPSVPSIGAGASAVTVSQGASATSTVTVMRGGGYTGTVTPSASGLPTGVTAVWSPTSGTGNTFILTLTASSGATVGTTTPTITMSGSGVTSATSAVGLTVRAAYTAVASDDFTTYADSAALVAAVSGSTKYYGSDGLNFWAVSLDASVQYKGHQTMKYDFVAGGTDSAMTVPIVPSGLYHLWAKMAVRWSPGFTTTGIINGYLNATPSGTVSITFSGGVYTAVFSVSQTGLAGTGIKCPGTATSDRDNTIGSFLVQSGSGTTYTVTKVNAATADTFTASAWAQTTAANPAGATSGSGYKFLFVAYGDANGRSGIELANTSNYVTFVGQSTIPGGVTYGLVDDFSQVAVVNEWTDGEFRECVIHYQATSTTATFEWWMKKASESTYHLVRSRVYTLATDSAPHFPLAVKLLLGRNYNQTRQPAQAHTLHWGQWEIVDGDAYANPYGVPL